MNAAQDDNGNWKSYVHAKRKDDPELWEVIDRNPAAIKRYPNTRFGRDKHGRLYKAAPGKEVRREVRGGSYSLYTRIWAAISPRDGLQPGYCAVVGEVHDGDFLPKLRNFVLIDEGVTMTDNPSLALHPDLFEATSALKDIYAFDRLYVDHRNEAFVTEINKAQWGISAYSDEDLMTDNDLKRAFPFFRHRDHRAHPMEPPYPSHDDRDFATVDALFARDRLRVHKCCETFRFGQYRTPHRALAMACTALQFWDWTEILRDMEPYDGYESAVPTAEELSEEEQLQHELDDFTWMVSDDRTRRALEESEREGYQKAVGLSYAR